MYGFEPHLERTPRPNEKRVKFDDVDYPYGVPVMGRCEKSSAPSRVRAACGV